jgi:hypothetical protein
MEEIKKAFNKGDFIKYTTYNSETQKKVTFGIFEGIDLAPEYQYSKKFSLAAYYDSYKYCSNLDNGVGWGYAPVLEVARDGKQCEKTIDTLVEDSWWSLCTPIEKRNAIEILAGYGYEWNEELLALVDINTGEIVHKIIIPKLEYNGDTIKPICNEFKDKLKNSIIKKAKPSYSGTNYRGNPQYVCYGYNGYDDENWD